ncbi:MAG TPA: SLC13 family permease, partial [Acidimicrobiales bacterium]
RAVGPALGFLVCGVPLAALLDRIGFFDEAAARLQRRFGALPMGLLWAGAAATTVVLNLDTTIVLLTPLYVRLARRAGVDPLRLALVPLCLASLASSVLPVSNLTTLIAADHLHLGVLDVVRHLGLPTLTAVVVGWLAYRRRFPEPAPVGTPAVVRPPVDDGPLPPQPPHPGPGAADGEDRLVAGRVAGRRPAARHVVGQRTLVWGLVREGWLVGRRSVRQGGSGDGPDSAQPRAVPEVRGDEPDEGDPVGEGRVGRAGRGLVVGGVIVAGLLVAFTVGPSFGVQPWASALVADLVLVGVTRTIPWRSMPLLTAAFVAGLAAAVAIATGPSLLESVVRASGAGPVAASTLAGAGAANVVNNIPATLVAVHGADRATPGLWAWLLGVNAGAALLPIGALANLLWWRIIAAESIPMSLGSYVRRVWPVVVPALLAAAVVLGALAR